MPLPQDVMYRPPIDGSMSTTDMQKTIDDQNALKVINFSPNHVAIGGSSPFEKAQRKNILDDLLNYQVDRKGNPLSGEDGSGILGDLPAQREGVKALSDANDRMQNLTPQVNLSPLMALIDSWAPKKSNLLAGYQKPETREDLALKQNTVQQMLQKSRGELTDADVKALSAAKPEVDPIKQARIDMQQERIDNNIHQGTISRLAKNPQLTQRLSQVQSLMSGMSLLTNADTLTPQSIMDAQQLIRSQLGMRGQSGVNEREGTFLKGLDLELEKTLAYLNSGAANISMDHPIIKHVMNLAKIEQNNSRQFYDSRMRALTSGNESMYHRRPDLQQDLDNAVGAYKDQVKEPAPYKDTSAKTPAAKINLGVQKKKYQLPNGDIVEASD